MNSTYRGHVLEVAVPVAVLLLWWQASRNSASVFFPPLSDILVAFKANWLFSRVASDVVPSLTRLGAGFAAAAFLGILCGIVLGLSAKVRRTMEPIVEFMRAIPAPALIPIGIIVLGVGDSMKIVIIALVCFWPILLTTTDGVRSVEPLVIESATVFRVPLRQQLWLVFLPAAAPHIFAGLRTSISLALVVMVISEMVASTNGIGFFVLQAQRTFDLPDMWSGVLLLGLLGYALNFLVLLLEIVCLKWHRGSRRATGSR